MRDAYIVRDGKMLSIEAFRSGRPVADPVAESRWKSYVAFPLWIPEVSELIVGVVTIASMADAGDSSLIPEKNSASLETSFAVLMEDIGKTIAKASVDTMIRYINSGGRLQVN